MGLFGARRREPPSSGGDDGLSPQAAQLRRDVLQLGIKGSGGASNPCRMKPDWEHIVHMTQDRYLPGGGDYTHVLKNHALAILALEHGDVQPGYVCDVFDDMAVICIVSEDLLNPIYLMAHVGDGSYQSFQETGLLVQGALVLFACMYSISKDSDILEGSNFGSIHPVFPLMYSTDFQTYKMHASRYQTEDIDRLYAKAGVFHDRGDHMKKYRFLHPLKSHDVHDYE